MNLAHEMAEDGRPLVAESQEWRILDHDQIPNQVCRMAIFRNRRIFGHELGIASGVFNFSKAAICGPISPPDKALRHIAHR